MGGVYPNTLRGAAAVLMVIGTGVAHGQQTYPVKPVRIIVPFSPGGGTDLIARLIAAKLSTVPGQQFVVENRAGAGSTIGSEVALKSPADGYTLLVTGVTYTVSPNLYNLRYDPLADITPIIRADDGPFVMVVHPSLPVRNVKQFVALAKSRPKQIAYATSGRGSITHLSSEWFSMLAGIQLVHVPYKGTGQSIVDTMAGHVQLTLAAVASAVPHLKFGRLNALAVTAPKRIAPLPDVPTLFEAGFEIEVNNWHGMLGPRGLSQPIVDKLNTDVNAIIKEPEFAQRIAAEGLIPAGGSPDRLLTLIKTELSNWARVVKQTGLKAD